MSYVQITGNLANISLLHTIPDLTIRHKSADQIDTDLYEVSAYCNEAAIPQIEALGLTVTVLATSAEREAAIKSIEDDSDGTTIV